MLLENLLRIINKTFLNTNFIFMKISKISIVVACCFAFTSSPAQHILKNQFHGNKDSLVTTATNMINLPEPVFNDGQPANADPATMADMGFEQVYKAEDYYFTTRDNKKIFAYKFPKKSNTTIILLHGVVSTAYLYNKTAGLLQKATQAEVYAVDLRGHGQSDGIPGDVSHINQYAEDLSDVIKAIQKEKPAGKIIIAAHSMGGGVALRYAMMKSKEKIAGYLLFAPLIGQNSPAIPKAAPVESDSTPSFMKIHIARIIGLKMLNEIGRHEYDSLPVLFFNLPERMPLRKYSYRANMSMAPDDYKAGLRSVKVPMLVLIGSSDEAFNAVELKKACNKFSGAEFKIINGATHNGVRHNDLSFDYIKKWYQTL